MSGLVHALSNIRRGSPKEGNEVHGGVLSEINMLLHQARQHIIPVIDKHTEGRYGLRAIPPHRAPTKRPHT